MKKGLMVFPPQWLPINPYASVWMLAGQLHEAGYEVSCWDSNLDFYDWILSTEHLRETLALLEREKPLPAEERRRYEDCIAQVPQALRVLKTGEGFYDLKRYQQAMDTVEQALFFASFRYPGQKVGLYNLYDGRFEWEYKNLLPICSGELPNMFYDFFMEQVKGLAESGVSYVCISLPCYTQLVPGFTLAYLLKKYTDIKVYMGGNIITRLEPGIRANRDILRVYCDALLLGDGEFSVVRLADYLHGACEAVDVPGLVWAEGERIFANPPDQKREMDRIAFPYFAGMKKDGYYCPELCFAIEFARGCYWGKCSFCAVDVSAKKYCMKTMERLVDEVEYLVMEHGIRNFVFVDEAIPVKKYVEFADEIIKRGLKIHFYSFARLERQYTKESLERLKQAGLSILWWGYESSSERVMEQMNKGIDVRERIPILRRAYDAGIWNHCLCMAGFPGESYEEIDKTFAEIRAHRELFNSCAMNAFFLSYNSAMYREPEKYGIRSIAIPKDLESHCEYKMDTYTEEGYQETVNRFRKEYEKENRHRLWAQIYNNFDHLLLYLKRYGIDRIRSYDGRVQSSLTEDADET